MTRILVVDDDFRVARAHASAVEGVPGCEVLAIESTAAGAVAAEHRHAPDLVLLDVHLPDGSGLDVLAGLACDALVVSADAQAATVRAALAAGAVGYLLKPFPPDDLRRHLCAYQRFRALLDGQETVDQEQVERALAARIPSGRAAPKGRSTVTERLVVDAVAAAHEPVTAAQVAELVGVSRATAQRYLATLVRAGAIDVRLRYGTTGRPEHEYRAADG